MKNRFKNILNIFIALTFLTQSIYADILDDAMKGMTADVIKLNSYTSGTGEQNYYTGSMSIRFNSASALRPIVTFTPPSIEVGCNGIDLKGMFMSLLGLSQLKDMLFDAGASLAWGIAIGLIYTLPGVASAFKWINAWAKKIQALLADACNAGTLIGQDIGRNAGINKIGFVDTFNKFMTELGPDDYPEKKQEGRSALLEAFGYKTGGDKMPKDEKQDAIVSLLRSVFESDASMMGGLMHTIAVERGADKVSSAFGGGAGGKAVSEAHGPLNSSTVSSLAGSGSNLTNISKTKMGLFAYVLIYNYVGDLAINPSTMDSLKVLYDGANTSLNKQGAADLENIKNTNGRMLSFVHGVSAGSAKSSGEALGKFIWYGTGGNNGSGPSGAYTVSPTVAANRVNSKKLIAPEITIYTIKDKSSSSKSSIIPVLKKELNSRNSGSYYDSGSSYKGTLMNSRCIVDWLVQGSGMTDDANQSQITQNNCNTEFVFPQLHKYVKIIKNSPAVDQFELKFLLTKVTSIKMANALLGAIGEGLGYIRTSGGGSIPTNDSSTNTSSSLAKSNMNAVLLQRDKISKVMYAAGDYLEDKLAGEAALQAKVDSKFELQARKNRERGLKSLQK